MLCQNEADQENTPITTNAQKEGENLLQGNFKIVL
jgi:hypothetical protein